MSQCHLVKDYRVSQGCGALFAEIMQNSLHLVSIAADVVSQIF